MLALLIVLGKAARRRKVEEMKIEMEQMPKASESAARPLD